MTAEVIWTTGAPVLRKDWDGAFYEVLSLNPAHVRMGRLNSGSAPLLANHDGSSLDSVLGVVTSARLSPSGGTARVRFAKGDPVAESVFNKMKQGVVRNVSVGYRVHKMEATKPAGDGTPTLLATDWEPYEISAVPMGADENARFRATEKQIMEDQKDETKSVVEMEQDRISGIRQLAKSLKFEPEFESQMIARGTSLSAARDQAVEILAKRSEGPPSSDRSYVEVGAGPSDKFLDGASAWLFERLGRNSPVQRAADARVRGFEKLNTDGGEFRGMSLFDLARESLERRGIRTRGMSRTTLMGTALTVRGGMATAGDFPVLLENVLNKLLLGAYQTTPDTWTKFCKTDTVPDFRTSNRYRTGSFSRLSTVAEGAEYTNLSIPDGEKQTISAQTKGNIISISRQALINDDLSSFADLAARLGRAGRLSIESDVYALLGQNGGLGSTQIDGNPFFYSGRGNVNSSGSALGVEGLDSDRVLLAQQTDPSGNELLDLKPAVLLVPIGIGGQARVVVGAKYDVTSGTTFEVPNKVYGLVRDVVDTARLTGTRRYLFADPGVSAAIVVAFLEGSGEAPYLEQHLGWRIDGTEMKVRLDYGVQFFDPRGAVTNAGV
jgi:HK97 family phage prohead protease